MALDGQRRQEPRHLESTHLERVPLAKEENVPADPRDVGPSRCGGYSAGCVWPRGRGRGVEPSVRSLGLPHGQPARRKRMPAMRDTPSGDSAERCRFPCA
jgi:hypothetical protein